MYNYELNKNEEVILLSEKSFLKKENEISNVTTIITNQRFIILELPTNLEEFRVGRSINYPIKKEVIFETSIDSIIEVSKENDFVKYQLVNTNYFYLSDDDVYDYMLNK